MQALQLYMLWPLHPKRDFIIEKNAPSLHVNKPLYRQELVWNSKRGNKIVFRKFASKRLAVQKMKSDLQSKVIKISQNNACLGNPITMLSTRKYTA